MPARARCRPEIQLSDSKIGNTGTRHNMKQDFVVQKSFQMTEEQFGTIFRGTKTISNDKGPNFETI